MDPVPTLGQTNQLPLPSIDEPLPASLEVNNLAQALFAGSRDPIGATTNRSNTSFAFTSLSTQSKSDQADQAVRAFAQALLGIEPDPTENLIPLGGALAGFEAEEAWGLDSLFGLLEPSDLGGTIPPMSPSLLQPNHQQKVFVNPLLGLKDSPTDSGLHTSSESNQVGAPASPDPFASRSTADPPIASVDWWNEPESEPNLPIGPARRRRERGPQSHPYQVASKPESSSPGASSTAKRPNSPTFFWLGRDKGWRFPPKLVEGAQRPTIGRHILAECIRCQQLVLPTPDAIASHQKLHGGNGELLCGHDSCIATFDTPTNRTTHLIKFHGINREEYCSLCQNNLHLPQSRSAIGCFQEHFLRHHLGVEDWKCLDCDDKKRRGRRVTTLDHLSRHHKDKHPDTRKSKDEIAEHYFNPNTGLPSNAHFFTTKEGKTLIAAYPNGRPPQDPRPVDWGEVQVIIHQSPSSADETN